jgi:hypothetical protein
MTDKAMLGEAGYVQRQGTCKEPTSKTVQGNRRGRRGRMMNERRRRVWELLWKERSKPGET